MTLYQAAILAQFFSMCICTAFLIIMLRQKTSEMSVLMLMTCVAATVQNCGYMLELTSQNTLQAITAIRGEYVGGAFTASLMFLFICRFCGVKIPSKFIYILVMFDIAVHFSVWSCDWNFLYYTSVGFEPNAVIPHAVLGKGPLYYVNMAVILSQLVISAVLVVKNCFFEHKARRKSAVFVLMSVSVPAVLFMLSMVCDLGGYDVVPVSEALGVLFLVIATVGGHIFDLVSSAYDNIIQTMDEAVIIANSSYEFMDANTQAKKLFPKTKEFMQLKPVSDPLLNELFHKETDSEIVYQERNYRVHRNRIMKAGEVEGYVLIFFDVTEEKQQMEHIRQLKEEADKANGAKSDFLARMSHEIRTPINAVIGMNEMILRESKEPDTRKYAFDSKASALMLLNIINDILDFSKIESGKMELVQSEYDFSSMLNNVYNVVSVKAAEKKLNLVFDVSEDIPSVLYGDDIRIRQVIINLLNNAVKYTPEGTVTLTIHSSRNGDRAVLCVSVADTGLGMNICVKLLELMGSELHVESVYGQGSTFSFELEQRIIDEKPIGDFKERLEEAVSSYSYAAAFKAPEAHILVVDDSDINCRVFVNLLKETKVQVETANSGQACLEAVKKKHFDLIFLDHMMPDMDGIETLHAMQNMEDHLCKDSPVIMLTANAVAGAREEYLKEGFDAFLTKPIISAKLEEMIAKMLPRELVQQDGNQPDHEAEQKKESDTEPGTVLPSIEGIDWAAAEEYFPSKELLLETARDFAASTDKEITLLLERVSDLEDEAVLDLYRIQVHAVKSTAAMIGALSLSELAKSLEAAANAKDKRFIEEKTPDLIQELAQCRDRLAVLKKDEEPKEDADMDVVMPLFYMLAECLEERDYDGADLLIKNIMSYRYEEDLQKRVDLLYSQVENLEAEAGSRTAKDIMDKIGGGVNE